MERARGVGIGGLSAAPGESDRGTKCVWVPKREGSACRAVCKQTQDTDSPGAAP